MLKLDCTLPNLTNICLHKSTDYKFYPFISTNNDLLEKTRADKNGGPSIVFTRKAVTKRHLFQSQTTCVKQSLLLMLVNSILILCVFYGLYTRSDYNEETQNFKAMQNRVRTFEIWSCLTFKQRYLNAKLRVTTVQKDKKILF